MNSFQCDVFVQGDHGIHTYRIPSLITTHQGTLLAFAEARTSRADVSGNEIAMRRSVDGGQTWDSVQIILSHKPDSYNNPCAVVLNTSNRILLFIQRYPYPTKERTVKPGLDGPEVVKNVYVYSDDDGLTWSDPIDITAQTKRPTRATSNAFGPGIGVQLTRGPHKGRIIVPMNQGPMGFWDVYMGYSDDNGHTWHMGETAPGSKATRGNEVQVVERADGSVLLNCRSFGWTGWFRKRCRLQAESTDGGQTWSPLRYHRTLVESSCMGSILRYSFPENGQENWILFSNPASAIRRMNGTLRLSFDEGKTWPRAHVIESGLFAYSCLAKLPSGEIACLYETGEKDGYERIRFLRVSPRIFFS